MSTSSSMAPASSDDEVAKFKAKTEKLEAKREKVEAEREKVKSLLAMDDDNLPGAYRVSPYKQWKDFTRPQLNEKEQQLSGEIRDLTQEIHDLRAAAPGKHPSELSLF